MSAYGLSKFAKESIGYFWNESYSNVHRTLNILTKEKAIKKSRNPAQEIRLSLKSPLKEKKNYLIGYRITNTQLSIVMSYY